MKLSADKMFCFLPKYNYSFKLHAFVHTCTLNPHMCYLNKKFVQVTVFVKVYRYPDNRSCHFSNFCICIENDFLLPRFDNISACVSPFSFHFPVLNLDLYVIVVTLDIYDNIIIQRVKYVIK